jgi:hypothetical protein
MDRNEAINLLREIQGRIAGLSLTAVTLTKAEPNDPSAIGYAIHLMGLCEENKNDATKISNEHGLGVKEGKDELTIFTPRT